MNTCFKHGNFVVAVAIAALFTVAAHAQRITVFSPEDTAQAAAFNEVLAGSLSTDLKIIDPSLAYSAFRSIEIAAPFNMSTAEARSAGGVIGTDLFILTDVRTQRRTSFALKEHFEASAAIYVVSSRSGELVHWSILRRTERNEDQAEAFLVKAASEISADLAKTVRSAYEHDLNRKSTMGLPPFPTDAEEKDPAFRAPIPYNRLRPKYTQLADFFGVRATVDIIVEINAAGNIINTQIDRWAGYGLDESVEHVVRSMNWRPAERNGTKLAKRVLLRYNFTKVDPDGQR
ncbi:MAG: energy transducer TonB [Blastocatellia bacterium]|nr:energy transducer TonB [Blastocatellia bacterium]